VTWYSLVQCATLMCSERFLGCLVICIDAASEKGKNSWGEPKLSVEVMFPSCKTLADFGLRSLL
jgi:hypothetical protein